MTEETVPYGSIQRAILLIRRQKVIPDRDLEALGRVSTRALMLAVKRNAARFPVDFMFSLDVQKAARLRSQTVTSNQDSRGGTSHP